MDGYDGGDGQLLADFASPRTEEAIAAARDDPGLRLPPTPCDGEEYDDLYGDVDLGFIPLLPLSPSPAPTSPPKTPSPGQSIQSPPQSPHRLPPLEPQPAPQRDPKLQPRPENPRHQQPQPLPPVPSPQPQRPARGGGASYSTPSRRTKLYISELHWWTTDAEVEAALAPAPHGSAAALYSLYFFADKFTGKSRGICCAEFRHPAAAVAAAAALHGHAFHGRQCVASLDRPPGLHRLGDDSDSDSYAEAAPSPNPTGGGLGNGGRGASDATAVPGNVPPALGDRPSKAQHQLSVVRQRSASHPFTGIVGALGGYGGFQSMGQYNAGMGNVMMSSALAHHVNPPFFGASGMAMRGSGVWQGQGMPGSIWGAQQEWNFRGCQMPWQQLTEPRQHQQAQQQFGNGNYGRGLRRERLSYKREERSIDNVRYLDRWHVDRDGGDCYKENDCEKGRHQEHILDKEREQEKHWNQRDRHGGDSRRHQDKEYTERADFGRRVRDRSRSQSRDDADEDHPRRRR